MRNLGLLILVSLSMAACSEEAAAPAGGTADTGAADTGAADTGAAALYRCADGTDIALEYACDNALDCNGGDDEKFCAKGGFVCGNGTVLADSDICDGTNDCTVDGEDEALCP